MAEPNEADPPAPPARSGPRPHSSDPLPPADAPGGAATASLILGVLALLFGPLTGLPAVILGIVALNRRGRRRVAAAGLALGLFGALVVPLLSYFFVLPILMRLREARDPLQDVANLRKVGVGLQKHTGTDEESMRNVRDWRAWQDATFPPVVSPVSWRVHLLPHMGRQSLYGRFRQDETWDGPTNLPLSRERVPEYVSALDSETATDTRYRVFGTAFNTASSDAALFRAPGPDGKVYATRVTWVTDGTSNTIFAAEAAGAVTWTEPKELWYDGKEPIPALGHPDRKGVFLVLMCDGSARAIPKDISEKTLRALITPGGGEVINPSDW